MGCHGSKKQDVRTCTEGVALPAGKTEQVLLSAGDCVARGVPCQTYNPQLIPCACIKIMRMIALPRTPINPNVRK